jgi:DnaK suppressor protein
MSRTDDLERLTELLHSRRRTIAESSREAQRELISLKEQERDPEYEESAQSELADFTLSRMIENARRELTQIDAALTRMDENDYGLCVDCGLPIPLERLEALPYAIRCEEDASRHEFEARGSHFAAPTL